MGNNKITISILYSLKNSIKNYSNNWNREHLMRQIKSEVEKIATSELFYDSEEIVEPIIDFYDNWIKCLNLEERLKLIETSGIENFIKEQINTISKEMYGTLRIDYESYKTKVLMYYKDSSYNDNIVYLATSHYTDQEYRTFLATLQKGRKRIRFNPANPMHNSYYSLDSIKDGYISRVKKSINSNTQDGYHADFQYTSDRFFLLKDSENQIDAVFDWIVKTTQAGVLPEWKTYLYNTLVEKGMVTKCTTINNTDIGLNGFILSDEVDTDLIREIRKEGIDLGEITIPRPSVNLEANMSFIEAMSKFIIPEINERKSLFTVGDKISPFISSPIIYKKNSKLKKTHLYPRQQVMAMGLLNGIKKGRNNIILNGGMGTGKTYISVKLANATVKEFLNKTAGAKISVFAQGHILPKWERQFKEALPDEKLTFYQVNSYKDVINLPDKKPEGLEIYLLPKDKVKRKYLESHSARRKYQTSLAYKNLYKKIADSKDRQNIYIANELKASELKLLARVLMNRYKNWFCLAKEVLNADGLVSSYKIASSSKLLKEKFGDKKTYYNFEIDSLDKILNLSEELEKEVEQTTFTISEIKKGLTCPTCGGFLYEKELDQVSEDDWGNIMYINPSGKSDRNKKCTNYIKVDGTPLTSQERLNIVKGNLDYVLDNDIKQAYLIDDIPVVDQDTLNDIKSGSYIGSYTIVLKKCDTPLWSAKDQKGYRTVNSIDMLQKRFGKGYFDFSISDESHLYGAQSNQGEAFAKLCRMSKVNIALTGTLTGGKASHLFYTLYRMIPHKMSKYFKYNESTKFIDHYGRRKKVTKEYGKNDKYNKSGVGKTSTSYSEIPGISPLLYSHFLSDVMISRKIEDMGFDMPPLLYFKHGIEMDTDVQEGYDKLKDDIITFMKANKDINLGGTYLNTLLAYPDMPITEPLMYDGMLISNPPKIDIQNRILPKEQKLIDTAKKEIQQGRRMVVYVTYTGDKAMDKRVEEILSKQGFKVALLKSSVATEKREDWIDKRYKEGVQIIVTNPKIVQTGLDIVGYPTMYFYQLDYDVRVVRQAESRAWRVGQEKDCYVYYSYYENSLSADALKLIGSKKKASLAIEGVFAEDILSTSGDEVLDSGITALYKSLLGKIVLKEDDLDFFSIEEEVEIEELSKDIEKTERKTNHKEEIQISFFTLTENDISKKQKKKIAIGQVSLFDM